jgi:hypothetical protein
MKALFVSLLFLMAVFIGCEQKKVEPLPVGEMTDYKDPGYGFKVKYPKDWKSLGTTGKAVFAKSQEVADKFQNPATGIEGAMMIVEVEKFDGKTPDAVVQAGKEDLKQTWQNIEIQPDAQLTVAGKQATNIRYSIPVTPKKKIIGADIFIPGDTAMYKMSILSFGEDQQTIHSALMNAMMNSFELPFIAPKKSDTWVASPNLDTYKSDFFTMQYPDNLIQVPQQKKDKDLVMELHADRLDCSIHIDVFGAKKLTADKVWEQNKGKYKAKATGETTVDGNKAYWVDYPAGIPNITSRAYFVVKNDKVIRASVNYFAPQKDAYFPIFEKCIASMKLK